MDDHKDYTAPAVPKRFIEEIFLKSGSVKEFNRMLCAVANRPYDESVHKTSLYLKAKRVVAEIKRLRKWPDKTQLNAYLKENFEFPRKKPKEPKDKNEDLTTEGGGLKMDCSGNKMSESKQIAHLLEVNEKLRKKIPSFQTSKQIEHLLEVNERLRKKIRTFQIYRINEKLKLKQRSIDRLKAKNKQLIQDKKFLEDFIMKKPNRQDKGTQCNSLQARPYKRPLFVKSVPTESVPVSAPKVQIVEVEPELIQLHICPEPVKEEVIDGTSGGMQVTEEELCNAVNSAINAIHPCEGNLYDINIDIPLYVPSVPEASLETETIPIKKQNLVPKKKPKLDVQETDHIYPTLFVPSVPGERLETVPIKKQKLVPKKKPKQCVEGTEHIYPTPKPGELWSSVEVANAEMEKIQTKKEQYIAIKQQIHLLMLSFVVREEDKHLSRFSENGKQHDLDKLKENFLILLGMYKSYLYTQYSILCGSIEEVIGRKYCHIVWKEDGTNPVMWTGKIISCNMQRRLLQVII